ncbi:hypothetical protein QRX60_38260 [Amycolatopsis mongoliensis]|uniref:Uncharacterized protein n=1 Tax=Amycolatopsis mongoliensis TaxID=715475 RepID=A0A9Y2JLV6_9PSEU|nr:hypothetical protein [Amycolatopsis sp. 4-36]WIX99855.1 hypothetical protein QRX60_38260 [Amycolatopsis sp. 4-36]
MTALSDDFPVLLGPVRLETRFTPTELLVRVFPDEWSVDKFETKPTAAEIGAVDAYWTARWAAAKRPVPLAAAWQELTGRVAAGRAAWLLTTRVPANPADEPAGLPATTVVLVVRTTAAVAANDKAPTVAYWTAVWRAHGDRLLLRQADAALRAAVNNNDTRANAIRARRPSGVDGAPVNPANDVAVAFLVLPAPAANSTAADSWTQPARARLLPDRFQVRGYLGSRQVVSVTGAAVPATLPVSPDPNAADQISVNEQTGALHVPDELRWLTDFDRAVAVGMGVRIPLTDEIRGGLDRLVAFGLREQSTPAKTATDFADLITRQLRSPDGFSLLPQGTPTNNTDVLAAGQDAEEEAAAALRSTTGAAAAAAADWTSRTDGRVFADLLGLDPATLTGMPNADRTDQRDARAANTALWPATWGYFLQTALNPLLGPAAVAATRDFFLKYVSGRGPLPAVKIGRQPYGILPTTVFSKLAYPDSATHRRALNKVLTAAGVDWTAAVARVPRLDPGAPDPHQRLLDLLALHPTSAEYHQRYAQSVEDLFNRENLGGLGSTVLPALDALGLPGPVRALLARFGADTGPGRDPDLLRRLFTDFQQPILAPLVDDRPLSETDRIRDYTPDHKNYVRWLADLAGGDPAATDLDAIRLELGFTDDTPPAALLYLLLRHAVLLGWDDAARALASAAGVPGLSTADSPFVHVRIPATGEQALSESRFRLLYSPATAVTGNPEQLLVDFIPGVLHQPGPTAALAEQVTALGLLADLPTAKLERVLAEHLDLAAYRLDAWRLGLATERLAELRFGPGGTGTAKPGLHLGAYGWLEDVRPSTDPLTPVTLTGPLATVFAGGKPLLHDEKNEGFVHTPSPGHARTAAVLRAGYAANRTPENPGTFAVNLGSGRVRVALGILAGLRQGQSLGALLGYRFERGLHDRHAEAEVDRFIAGLRLKFPLRAGKITETAAEPDKITQVEAGNVVDGLALVRHLAGAGVSQTYPFGLAGLPEANTDQAKAISDEAALLVDANDAVADLAVAESAHQALAGNVERASATLDAYAKDGLPPEPTVIETPRSGTTLTHRFGLRLRTGLNPGGGDSPRAKAEPAVDDWLPSLLPSPRSVAARVTWTDEDGHPRHHDVTQDELDLSPIDLLWAVRPTGDPAMAELDDRIIGVVVEDDHPRPDAELTIRYTEQIDGKITFFQLSPLVTALRTLLTTGRPLRPTDLVPAAGSAAVDRSLDDAVTVTRRRPEAVRDALGRLADDVAGYIGDVAKLYPPSPAPPKRADVLDRIDTLLTRYADLVTTAAGFGVVRSGWGELITWRRGVFSAVLAAVAAVADRMAGALAAANALLTAYDALPKSTPDAERIRLLRQAERLVVTTPALDPKTPNEFRSAVRHKRDDFADRLKDLQDVAGTHRTTLSDLLDDVGRLSVAAFDPTGLDLTAVQDQVVGFGRELLTRARALQTDVTGRLAAANTALTGFDQAVTPADRTKSAIEALQAMLGTDVLVVPEYALPDQLAEDLHDALDDSNDLVAHLTQAPVNRDFPVDDWLHGIARVREMPRLWERVVLLGDALRGNDGLLGSNAENDDDTRLQPIQLPLRSGDHWLGMEFAAGADLTEDRLLFTAHYATQPSRNADSECGLLFDEWTEVIPAERETTSIAVHADSPDSEPPQAMLLVTPPVKTGTWAADDLVAAVNETFDLAKTRLVEPVHLDDTGYAQLLPATVLSATRQPITISTDLAIANSRWKADHE